MKTVVGKLIHEHLWGRRTGPLSVRWGGGGRTKSRSRRGTRAVYPASELSGEITLLLLLVWLYYLVFLLPSPRV